jgi:hypothetical protein
VDGEGELDGLHTCRSAYANLVDVPSVELPNLVRVMPGDPQRSWLVQKLDGTQHDSDGRCVDTCGDAMPLGEKPLPSSVRAAVRAWIAGGAIDDCP